MEILLNRLPKLTLKQRKVIDFISRYSFYLGLFIELTIVILEKSEYIIQYEGLWFRFTFLLFSLSLVTKKRSLVQWLWFFLFAVLGGISYGVTGRNEILRAVVFVWACYGKEMKKVLKVAFWYTLFGCLIIFLLSVLGIYGEIYVEAVYRVEEAWTAGTIERRYCFGMGHPNSFHGMMLAITWLGVYCYYDKLKWYGYGLLTLLHIILFLFTNSRTSLFMSLSSLTIFIILKYAKSLQKNRVIYILGILTIISAVAFSIFMAKYSIHHPFLKRIDGFLSNRILNLYYHSVNHEGMLNTWFWWSAERNSWYFDLGIIRMFYWYGIIPAAIYYFAQCRLIWCGFKKKDFMLLAVMVVITIYSVFEAHFISDYMGRNYILFFFGLYLPELIGDKREKI